MINNLYEKEEKYIKFLQNKGLNFVNEDTNKIKEILYKENYNILVKEYQNIFINKNTKNFEKGITFYHIKSVYDFDKNIKNIYLKYILKIEHQIKTVIAKVFEFYYGDKEYFKIENYDIYNQDFTLNFEKVKSVLGLISKLENILAEKIDKNNKISSAFLNAGYVSFNIFVSVLTLGEISKFFESLKEKDQRTIAKIFLIKSEDLKLALKNLTIIRNICAHDEKFYSMKFKKSFNLKNFDKTNIFKSFCNSNDFYSRNDLFGITIIIFSLLDEDDSKNFYQNIKNELDTLKENTSESILSKIKNEMGFNDCYFK